jgi:hypothetical protein
MQTSHLTAKHVRVMCKRALGHLNCRMNEHRPSNGDSNIAAQSKKSNIETVKSFKLIFGSQLQFNQTWTLQ